MSSYRNLKNGTLDKYRSLSWYGQPVYSTYPRLVSYLRINLGSEFAELLAYPQIVTTNQGSPQIYWGSDQVGYQATPLSQLAPHEKAMAFKRFEAKVLIVQQYAKKLINSLQEEERKWGQLLEKAFTIPDEEHIFVDGDSVVATAWGFELTTSHKDALFSTSGVHTEENPFTGTPFSIPPSSPDTSALLPEEKTEGYDSPSSPASLGLPSSTPRKEEDARAESIDVPPPVDPSASPPKNDSVQRSPETSETDPFATLSDKTPVDNDSVQQNLQKTERIELAIPTDVPLPPPPPPLGGQAVNAPLSSSQLTDKEFVQAPGAPEQTKNNSNDGGAPTYPPSQPPASHYRPKGCFKWGVLLLLLLLLFFVLFKWCNTTPNPLPEIPGIIVPIDSSAVGVSPDSMKSIVSNRLNIALTGENVDITNFAKDFKIAYPGDQFRIIYYDTLTYRLQIQVPDTLREALMEEIPEKLKKYKMLIWHESLFDRGKIPMDPGFSDISQAWYFKAVKADLAWDKSYGQPDLIVAIIDDGFDLNHPEFTGKVVKPWNVCEHSSNVMTNPGAKHGTHVASTAVGLRDNNNGSAGIAPDCKLMPIQVSDRNGFITSTAVIDAVLYAIHQGANVVNLSLGLSINDVVTTYPLNAQLDIIKHSQLEEERFWDKIFKMADERNVTLVLAAGNQNVMAGIDPMQRNPLGIKVSAVDDKGVKAQFSNYGPYATISAPGVNIYNATPGNQYEFLSGTSMAAPIVTGGIALIKSAKPDISNRELIDLLQKTGLPVLAPSQKVGPIIQLDKALGASPSSSSCPDIKQKIDSLLEEIERLKEACPDAVGSVDTMKMPEKLDNFDFCVGRWKSTTYINNSDGEKVTIYLDLYPDKKGKITLVELNNTQCVADLDLSIAKNALLIDQQKPAGCNPPPQFYNQYHFSCQPDAEGYAECIAQNKKLKANHFKFRLVKIK